MWLNDSMCAACGKSTSLTARKICLNMSMRLENFVHDNYNKVDSNNYKRKNRKDEAFDNRPAILCNVG